MSFSPPSGIVFLSPEELPVVELTAMLQRVARFLQGLQPSSPELLRYHDWWEHDGLHFEKGVVSFGDVFAMIATPRAIFEATPDDFWVHMGISPRDGSWYLRFRAEWDDDGQGLTGSFALVLPASLAASFRTSVASQSPCLLSEEASADYYRRVIL